MPMQTTVKAAHKPASRAKADALVLFARPDRIVPRWLRDEEPELAKALSALIKARELTGRAGNRVLYHCLDKPFRRVIVIGVGKDPDLSGLQNRFADMARDLRDKHITRFAIVLPDDLYDQGSEEIARALAEAAPISCYEFHKFMATPDPKVNLTVELLTRTKAEVKGTKRSVERGLAVGKGVTFSRDLCNMPGNVATPEYMAETAKAIAKKAGGKLRVQVLGRKQMEKRGMGLFTAVAQGSPLEPKLICIDYTGNPRSKERIAVVGKCITFDAGGISIKPPKGMMVMKRDKMGGTNVLGLASILRFLKPKLNISFVVAAAENMPSGTAYRPGDCIQAMNGKWVEIISTDAEGRLVLADSLTWVQETREPTMILDMATLTGGAEKALGGGMIAGFANDEGLWERIERSSTLSGEPIWRLPLFQPYKKGVRSYFAETKNSSTTPPSTIKAALFLEEWIDPGVRWAHLDIAASMSMNRPSGIHTRGATGMGLRLAASLLHSLETEGF